MNAVEKAIALQAAVNEARDALNRAVSDANRGGVYTELELYQVSHPDGTYIMTVTSRCFVDPTQLSD